MSEIKPKVLVIVGPTASGKTALSIALAKKFSGEVISADSRQVYTKLDIGTEKISHDEMAGVPHHLLDVSEINTVYSASDFKIAGMEAITQIRTNGHLPIIAGGTFFYIDTLLGKIMSPDIEPNTELRNALELKDEATLYSSLLKLDARRAEDIDPSNKRRLIRALEIVAAIGKVPVQEEQELPYDAFIIGIKTDKKELRDRIRTRAEQALTRGLIEETQGLLDAGITKARLNEIGHEYRLTLQYMDGTLTDAELIQKMEEKNWQYAKRQLTWLKRDPTINWFERTDIENITKQVTTFLTTP